MDHLPYPQNSPLPPLSVPYYTKYKFDNGSFTDYSTRCGFDKSNFRYGDFRAIPWDDQTAFLQAWLFFGVIHECLGAPAGDFIDQNTGIITTKELPRWCQKWRKDLPFSRSKRQAEYERVQNCLRETCAALITLDGVDADKSFAANLSEEVAFSIAVLGITLDQISIKYDVITRNGGDAEEREQLSQLNIWPTTRFARKRLETAGWCRSETKRLERYMKATGIYYCGSIETIGRQVDHSKCEESGCMAENVVEATYVTAHADDCMRGQKEASADCKHVGPVVAEVAAILDADDLPLLELKRNSSIQEIQLRAVPYKDSISYTALSHVWADGMGNPHANTLPQCQIDRLYALLISLNSQSSSIKSKLWGSNRSKSDAAYVWMDTLLIPLQKRLRKKAISRMYDIYKNARNVLVLDRSLLDVSADRPPEELCFRLSAASWMRRAWTLQEGALANNLFVQCKERAVNPVKLANKAYERIWKSEPWNAVLEDCGAVIGSITLSGDAGEAAQLHHVLQGLGQRSTSHPEDREICFAVMLKMDMKRILEVEGAERTLRIVRQMPYIPRSFVWHSRPCLDLDGFRWLPGDVISSGAGIPELGLNLVEHDLVIEEAALVFRGRTHYLGKSAQHIRDVQTAKWYALIWEGDGAEAKKLVESERTWTVLVALPNRVTMFHTLQAVILRLDWVLQSPASGELLEHIHGDAAIKGEFVGRGRLQELDEATTERMKGQTGVKQDQLQGFREDVRSGKSSLEGVSEAMKRLYEEEGDDSWYILDGVMQRLKRKWLIN